MPLKTERLMIRELTFEDWPDMQQIALDFMQSPYAAYDRPLPVEESAIRTLTKQFARSGLFFAVFRQGQPGMIGYICFHPEGESYDLGYCFHSRFQGNGYALESCTALLRYMEKERGAVAFSAGTALANIPSYHLLQKLGFVLEETETLSFHKDEAGRDMVFEGGRFVRRSV